MDKKEYKSLKFFVYFMGLMLVVGMLIIVCSIYKLVTKPNNQCLVQNYKFDSLSFGSEINSIAADGHKFIIVLSPQNSEQKIIIVNKCNGEVENSFSIKINSKLPD